MSSVCKLKRWWQNLNSIFAANVGAWQRNKTASFHVLLKTCLRPKPFQNNTWKPDYWTPGHNWLHMYSREWSQSVMSALLSGVTVQWFRKTIKVPVHSPILCCTLIKDKRSCETANHTGLCIDFHYHSQWLPHMHTSKHTLKEPNSSVSVCRIVQSASSDFQKHPIKAQLSVKQQPDYRI